MIELKKYDSLHSLLRRSQQQLVEHKGGVLLPVHKIYYCTVTSDFNSIPGTAQVISQVAGLAFECIEEKKVREMMTFYVYIRTWSHTNVSKQWWCIRLITRLIIIRLTIRLA